MRNNSFAKLAGAAAIVLGAASIGSAAPIIAIDDGFEYADQAAYDAAWPAINAGANATLDSTRAASGSKSVLTPAATTLTTNNNRSRKVFGDIAAPNQNTTVTWSFDFYDSQTTAATTGAPNRNYANLQDTTAPGGTNQLISMGLNNNQTGANSGGQYYMARILGATTAAVDPDGGPNESVTGSGIYFKLNDYGVGLRSTGWHNLKVVISSDDGLSTDYAFYVDNQLAETVNNVGSAATSFRQFDNITIGSGFSNGGVDAGFDNMYLASVPEPTTLAALGAAGALLGRRRRA